ncbi:hypothetical protein HZH66_014333 [Vespula vulgaris]|uniref:Uncharacterized protein n=1 Tax=Vespula vulgaris TaxID=7454 RepID=A0A834MPZ0_VESVU|nr:hypothetical protein HZH66_014333 [Vespula vulgaris]
MPIAGRVPYRQNALSSGASSSKADCSLACGNSIYGTLKWYPVSGTAPPPPPSPHLHPPLAETEYESLVPLDFRDRYDLSRARRDARDATIAFASKRTVVFGKGVNPAVDSKPYTLTFDIFRIVPYARRVGGVGRPPTSTLKGDIRIDLTSGGLGSSSSVKNLFPSNREYSSSRAFGRRDVPDRNVYASFRSREEASRNYLYPTHCPFMRPITRLTLRCEIVAYEWQ